MRAYLEQSQRWIKIPPANEFRQVMASDDAEALLGFFTDHAWIPGWVPYQIDAGITDPFQRHDSLFGIGGDHRSHAAAGGRQRHLDGDFIVIHLDVVNQTEVDDIHWNLRIVTVVENFVNLL